MSHPMTWFVASFRDHDTHQAAELTEGIMTARCGQQFRPLTQLRGTPPDPLQICLTCAQSLSTKNPGPRPAAKYRMKGTS